ncbi:MAG: hypothetical protein IJX30_01415 [Clostridia bacterium]|nr:hypothetical protein [Clostridia bacterium]
MKKYEHIQRFTVKYCDADFKDELKVSALLAYLEEVACSSADELGFGYAYVKPRGYAFMVSNLCCEFFTPVNLGETITLKTWPTPPTHVVFGREYQVLSEKEEVKINASSRWCLIDMNSGKLLPSKVIDNQDYTTYNTTKLMENIRWKIPAFSVGDEPCKFTLTIANSEYDHNMHVNNTRYADYCFNCFSVQELSERKLKKFMISYVKQCKEGEVLRFYREKGEDGGYLVQGVNGQNETVVQAYILFEE